MFPRGKPNSLRKFNEIGWINVGLADNGDSLAGAVDRCAGVPEWKNVVDRSEVVWSYPISRDATVIDREGRPGCPGNCSGRGVVRLVAAS